MRDTRLGLGSSWGGRERIDRAANTYGDISLVRHHCNINTYTIKSTTGVCHLVNSQGLHWTLYHPYSKVVRGPVRRRVRIYPGADLREGAATPRAQKSPV